MTAISFRGVDKAFGAKSVVRGLNLDVATGKITVLLGPSGTGKSTLLRMALGLLPVDAGSIVTLGVDVTTASRRELNAMRRRASMLFQEGALFGSLSVAENVAFPMIHVGNMPPARALARAHELLASVGLPDVDDRRPDALSGGQKRRVALARALALEPELVLFDEPTSGLDPQTSAAIDELIRRTQRERSCTFVVITHDVTSAMALADQAGLLLAGQLRVFGDAETVWRSTEPEVRAFLDRVPAQLG